MAEIFEEEQSWAVYRQRIEDGKNTEAIEIALKALADRQRTNPQQYPSDHKGTPFYVLGYASFASHDYSGASLFFDAAVSADLKYHAGNLDTAAIRFLRLLHDPNEQLLATGIINEIVQTLQMLLDDYNARVQLRALTVEEVRKRFLEKMVASSNLDQRSLATTLISYIAEWPYRDRLLGLVADGSREPFFLHLYRGCLLFESILKATGGIQARAALGDCLTHHRVALGIGQIRTSADTLANVIATLTSNMSIEQSITVTAKSRNTLGHNVVQPTNNFTRQSYEAMFKHIANASLHAIAKLFP